MRTTKNVVLSVLLMLCSTALWSSAALVDERLPPLGFIPDSLPSEQQVPLADRRQALQQQLATFQAAASKFNDEPADSQSVDDFNALQTQRANYIAAAKAFNRDLAATTAATTTAVRAALPIANVTASGEFYFIVKDGRKVTRAEATQLPLDGGTRAMTGPTGHIKMQLLDGTVFTLGPDSDMVIDDFIYDANHTLTKASVSLTKGVFRWVTGKIAERAADVMKLKVAVGIIGPRGTDFEVRVEPNGSGYVKLFQGQADITEKKTGAVLTLDAGQMVRFAADGTFGQKTLLKP